MATARDMSSLEKGLLVLRELAVSGGGVSAGQLAAAAGLNRTTVYRLCEVLERGDWVTSSSDGESTRFDLGAAALGLAVLIGNKYDTQARLQPVISELSQVLGETVHVGVLDHREVTHVARALPASGVSVAARLGSREHAHCAALGKVLLATLPDSTVGELYPDENLPVRTAHSIATRTALLLELAKIRSAGYAVDDEEGQLGVKCVAAPVFASGGRAVLAISVTSVPPRLGDADLPRVVDAVRGAAALLSAAFGGSIPSAWGVR